MYYEVGTRLKFIPIKGDEESLPHLNNKWCQVVSPERHVSFDALEPFKKHEICVEFLDEGLGVWLAHLDELHVI